MRKVVILALVSVPIALVAASGAAAPSGPGTQPVQPKLPPTAQPRLDLPARIVSVKRTPPKGFAVPILNKYSEGALSYDVEIAAPASSPLATSFIAERMDATPTVVAKLAVSAGPGERTTITFEDKSGLKTGCASTEYRLKLESSNTTRSLRVKPTCTFSGEAIDPMAGTPPDTKLAQRQNKLFYYSPSATPAATPVCGMPLEMKATVRNDASSPAIDARLRIDAPGNDAAGAVFDLAPGKIAPASVSTPFLGHPGNYTLRLEGGGAATWQPGWHVKVTRSCGIDLDLD
jgi:hypothetical protein